MQLARRRRENALHAGRECARNEQTPENQTVTELAHRHAPAAIAALAAALDNPRHTVPAARLLLALAEKTPASAEKAEEPQGPIGPIERIFV